MTDKRGKLETECDASEKAMIEKWYVSAHPTNHPKKRSEARWKFGAYGASLHLGYL